MIFYKVGNKEDVKKIIKIMRYKKTSGEIDYQCMDFKKVNKYFGWAPTISLEEGLKISLDCYKGYLSK